MSLLSLLLLAVAFFVGNIQCDSSDDDGLIQGYVDLCSKTGAKNITSCVLNLALGQMHGLQSDIDELKSENQNLDQMLKSKDLTAETGTEIIGHLFNLRTTDLKW